jgi:Acetyltransferase (GNAT) domain
VKARVLSVAEEAAWNEWLRTVTGSNSRQTSFYRAALSLYGHQSEIFVLEDSGCFCAGCLLDVQYRGFLGPVIRASGGVALKDPRDRDLLLWFLHALLDHCARLGASSVDLSLRIPKRTGEHENPAAAPLENGLRSEGFRPRDVSGTYVVDLNVASDEALLESLGKNPRRHIRKGLRDGLCVERSTDPRDISEFLATHDRLHRRKRLEVLPKGMADAFLVPLIEAGFADLFVARFKGVPRNYIVIDSINGPVYHWGAIAESAFEDGCPQTGQPLHYGAMRHYRSLGHTEYDLGGSPGPVPDSSHQNFSVWKFKHEFGGRYVSFLGHWQRVLRPMSAAVIEFLRRSSRPTTALRKRIMGRAPVP